MPFDLPAMARRARNVRRKTITIRDIIPPQMLARDLARTAYAPIVAVWEDATPRIMDAYALSLAQMTMDSPADVQREIEAADGEASRLFLLLDARLRDWTLRVERWFRGKWRGAILSATGVDLGTLIGPEGVRASLETHLAWNADLVRDVSAQTRQRISAAVFDGLRARTPAREVAAKIREATGLARDRSTRIASDQLTKLTSSLAQERRREAGLSVYKHRHSGKRHPRTTHLERDGKLYSENPADVGKKLEGKTILPPVASNDRAGFPPFCGCREQSILVFSFDGDAE